MGLFNRRVNARAAGAGKAGLGELKKAAIPLKKYVDSIMQRKNYDSRVVKLLSTIEKITESTNPSGLGLSEERVESAYRFLEELENRPVRFVSKERGKPDDVTCLLVCRADGNLKMFGLPDDVGADMVFTAPRDTFNKVYSENSELDRWLPENRKKAAGMLKLGGRLAYGISVEGDAELAVIMNEGFRLLRGIQKEMGRSEFTRAKIG